MENPLSLLPISAILFPRCLPTAIHSSLLPNIPFTTFLSSPAFLLALLYSTWQIASGNALFIFEDPAMHFLFKDPGNGLCC